jgi:hypothetical protein
VTTYRLTPITESTAEITLRQIAATHDAKLRTVLTAAELDANRALIHAVVSRGES